MQAFAYGGAPATKGEGDQLRVEHWRDAELLAAEWMRDHGFSGARVTGGSADAGIDVRANGAIAQVKMERKPVGRPALQRLVGARGTDTTLDLLFFSASGYSSAAIAYALSLDIALLTYTLDGVVSPVNSHARDIKRPQPQSRSKTRKRGSEPSGEFFAVLVVTVIGVVWYLLQQVVPHPGLSLLAAIGLVGVIVVAVLCLAPPFKGEGQSTSAAPARRSGPSLFDYPAPDKPQPRPETSKPIVKGPLTTGPQTPSAGLADGATDCNLFNYPLPRDDPPASGG